MLWAIYILMLPNLIGYSKWLIQIVLQLEVICQFSRHYKQCQCQIFMEYTCMYTNFWSLSGSFWMWWLTRWKMIEKLWRVWQFKWESTHLFWSTSHMQLVVVQTAILTVCTQVPKHLQFAQINKKFQSNVKKKLIVQRSHSRIELKQLRKTAIVI